MPKELLPYLLKLFDNTGKDHARQTNEQANIYTAETKPVIMSYQFKGQREQKHLGQWYGSGHF